MLHGRKVATVFEDPTVQASDTEVYRGITQELCIYGTGFNNVVQPTLVFAPPLDNEAVNVHVSSGFEELLVLARRFLSVAHDVNLLAKQRTTPKLSFSCPVGVCWLR